MVEKKKTALEKLIAKEHKQIGKPGGPKTKKQAIAIALSIGRKRGLKGAEKKGK